MNTPPGIVERIEYMGGHPSANTIEGSSPRPASGRGAGGKGLREGMVPIPNGPEHWAELHQQLRPTREWFNGWLARIPNFGCNCSNKFAPILTRYLPVIEAILGKHEERRTNNQDWFSLTVQLHNAVNQELGRPQMTLSDATARWASPSHTNPYQWKRLPTKNKEPRTKNIAFLAIDYSRIGGTETFATTLLPRLPNVIGFASLNPLFGDTSALGVPAYSGPEAIRDLCNHSDTVVSWLINPRDYGYTGRVIMVHHGSPSDEGQTAASLAAGDAIVCVSRSTAEHMRKLTQKPVHWIPNAVDPARLIPRTKPQEPRTKHTVVWLHRCAPDKRPELAIEIAQHLPPDWHMILAGYNGGIALPTSDRVTILPPQHPGDLLTRASCFLSTSLFDGFGLSVAEAIAAGVPVVSSPAGIATEPGLATLVDHDAPPSEWAAAIVAAARRKTRPQLPAEYNLTTHVENWLRVLSS